MQITLNGKPYTLKNQVNLSELSEILKLEPTQVAIERNHEIIPRSLYRQTMLEEGDEIEIVTFIGGG
ncbi:MAG: sulfur carrier protein ThiS [Rickettsiales bacterium]